MENKGSNVRYNKINITFPDMAKVENIIPRNMIINLGCASVDNHIPQDDIFDYHHVREGNIYIVFEQRKLSFLDYFFQNLCCIMPRERHKRKLFGTKPHLCESLMTFDMRSRCL